MQYDVQITCPVKEKSEVNIGRDFAKPSRDFHMIRSHFYVHKRAEHLPL